jgi:glycosyltransferase involved in cell wall biosynthesis
MLAGSDIVCFANDWAGDPLSKKHVMRRLARRNRVLWVESLGNRPPRADAHDARRLGEKLLGFARGLRRVEENLWVLTPLAVPAYRARWAARVNRALVGATVRAALRRLAFRRPITYTFVPASAWVVGRLGESRIVYHCVDEYRAFAGAGPEIAALDERLCRAADLVITCSQPLADHRRPWNPRTVVVRHGVDHPHFARALDPATPIPNDIAHLPRPILGFHGLVAEWVDLALIRRVARAFPRASLVLVGETRVPLRPLEGVQNLHILGRRPYQDLPGYCRAFDVALLPFVIDDLTWNACPLKLREYLAAGLPVVATAIPEAKVLEPLVRTAGDQDGFVEEVKAALERPGVDPARSRAMEGETWDRQVARIEELIDGLDRPLVDRAGE